MLNCTIRGVGVFVIAVTVGSIATGACAADYGRYFGDKPGGRVCYYRRVDTTELRANDARKVRQIALDFDVAKSGGAANAASRFAILLAAQPRDRKSWSTRAGLCKERTAGGFECALEGEGGRFALEPDGMGLNMRLAGPLALAGADSFAFGGAVGADDIFALAPAVNRLCDGAAEKAR